jgi:hypothetical protein
MDQVVEYLTSMCKALGSIPSEGRRSQVSFCPDVDTQLLSTFYWKDCPFLCVLLWPFRNRGSTYVVVYFWTTPSHLTVCMCVPALTPTIVTTAAL